jgi:hypothetical protein
LEYLGITIDRRLNFTPHAKNVRAICTAKRTALRPIFNRHVPLRLRIHLSNAILRPNLLYAAPA